MSVVVLEEADLERMIENAVRKALPAQARPEDRRVRSTEAAAAAGVSTATIRVWASAGKIKQYGEGRGVRYSLAEVLAVRPTGTKKLDAESQAEAIWRRHNGQ